MREPNQRHSPVLMNSPQVSPVSHCRTVQTLGHQGRRCQSLFPQMMLLQKSPYLLIVSYRMSRLD
jgi:hypothetical protein